DLLAMRQISKSELCATARVSPGHLADMLHRAKGASPEVVRRLAAAFGCSDATLAPELAGFAAPGRDRAGSRGGRSGCAGDHRPLGVGDDDVVEEPEPDCRGAGDQVRGGLPV